MIEDILKAIPLGFFLAFMLGPVFFALLETSAIKGFRAALALDIGVMAADVVFICIAYFSTSGILEKLKDDPSLYIFGGAILFLYGAISWVKTKKNYLNDIDPEVVTVYKNNYFKLMVKGFFLNFINIGVLGFWLGLIVLFGPKLDNDGSRVTVFFGTVLLVYLAVDILKILLAKRLNKNLTPKRIFVLRRIISIIMLICGTVLIFKGAFPDETEDALQQIHIIPEQEDPQTSDSLAPDEQPSEPVRNRQQKTRPVKQEKSNKEEEIPTMDPNERAEQGLDG
jgi:threonine/homoserine/homoserine lactone efflux protein